MLVRRPHSAPIQDWHAMHRESVSISSHQYADAEALGPGLGDGVGVERPATTNMRQLTALARAASRQLICGFRLASKESAQWRARATCIADPRLRDNALHGIDGKSTNIHSAALFWTLPHSRSQTLLHLLVVFEVMADYLDCLDAHAAKGPELQRALVDAFDRSARNAGPLPEAPLWRRRQLTSSLSRDLASVRPHQPVSRGRDCGCTSHVRGARLGASGQWCRSCLASSSRLNTALGDHEIRMAFAPKKQSSSGCCSYPHQDAGVQPDS